MRSVLLVAVTVAAATASAATEAAKPAPAEIDRVFTDLDRPDSPGCALAVVRDGRAAYERGYGMANLEHRVAITPHTVFDIGSTSKQFTAAAVHLLAAEGRLSLDDDVRRWVPELPAYDTGRITVRHLLHHTSGIRDYLELMDLTGVRFEDVSTDEDALSLLSRQKAANFAPGAEYLYSNSGFFLLSIVVKRASGRSLRDFAAERIFAPLGMRETHFHDDHAMVVPNRATGYERGEGASFKIDMSNFEQTGDGGVYTTVEDLLRWDGNFYEPVVGGPRLLEGLLRPGTLRDGQPLKYASGLSVDAYRGLKTVSHGGSWAGYRAELLRFPDERLSVICLCNVSDARPSRRAREVAGLFLADKMAPDAAAPSPSASGPAAPPTLSGLQYGDYAGEYFSPELDTTFRIVARDDRLRLVRRNRPEQGLTPTAADQFSAGDLILRFRRGVDGHVVGFALDRGRIRNVSFSVAGR
ncbi:MAG TPA: serine hydrolase domain-containing protein [Vicinamibacteria bacterium]|nr:serine hydrolase domain-containing protein [Vicinamibacteria bacterium]